MLRWALLLSSVGLLVYGLHYGIKHDTYLQPFLIWGAILTVAVLGERWRYRHSHSDGGHWVRTDERFQDPASGETVEVHYNPDSGERRYVKASKPAKQ